MLKGFAADNSHVGLEDFPSDRAVSPGTPSNVAQFSLRKCDEELQIVYGEVYAPGIPDSQGDFMTPESIREMAHEFMRKGLVDKIDLNHTQVESGCYVVESFIARDDDTLFIPNSWVLGVKVPDPITWDLVKKGELNGFSLDGMGFRMETLVEIDMPEVITGQTLEQDGHTHEFFVKYDADGLFVGGLTGPGPDGHVHPILRGTVTETAEHHCHRFSFVEGVLSAQVADQGD